MCTTWSQKALERKETQARSRTTSQTSPGRAGTGVTGSSTEQEGQEDGGCKAGGARGHRWVRRRGEETRLAVAWPKVRCEQINRELLGKRREPRERVQ